MLKCQVLARQSNAIHAIAHKVKYQITRKPLRHKNYDEWQHVKENHFMKFFWFILYENERRTKSKGPFLSSIYAATPIFSFLTGFEPRPTLIKI